jgi:hypothetical protein
LGLCVGGHASGSEETISLAGLEDKVEKSDPSVSKTQILQS